MKLQEAQKLLEPYHMIIRFDDTLKMYQVFLGVGAIYFSEEDMKAMDESNFKVAVAQGIMKDTVENPQVTLQ